MRFDRLLRNERHEADSMFRAGLSASIEAVHRRPALRIPLAAATHIRAETGSSSSGIVCCLVVHRWAANNTWP
jgi:hypothetical protein